MKNLIFVNGTMGAGKTAVCKELQNMLLPAVFLDGDWCWNMKPFVVTEETKKMVTENICFLLNNFLKCPEFQNIIFCWVMHRQDVIDSILQHLDLTGVRYYLFTLMLSEQALQKRLEKDISAGLRTDEILARSRSRLPLYKEMESIKIDVSEISTKEAAEWIADYVSKE